MRAPSTEYVIYTSFEFGMFAKRPLETEEFLGNPDFPLAVSFFYGDIDWMDKTSGERVIGKNKFKN